MPAEIYFPAPTTRRRDPKQLHLGQDSLYVRDQQALGLFDATIHADAVQDGTAPQTRLYSSMTTYGAVLH